MLLNNQGLCVQLWAVRCRFQHRFVPWFGSSDGFLVQLPLVADSCMNLDLRNK